MMAFEAVEDVCLAQAHAREILPFEAADQDGTDWNKSDTDAAPEANLSSYLNRLFLPLRREGGQLIVALANTGAENIAWLRAAYGPLRTISVPKEALLAEIRRRFASRLTEDSIFALATETPSLSARKVITSGQRAILCLLLLAIGASALVWTSDAAWTLVAAMSFVLWLTVLFRGVLALIGSGRNEKVPPLPGGQDANLPLYTVVVPLYREAHMIPALSRFLLDLDYPRDRLQIMIALEADDRETALAAATLSGVAPFEIVHVPPSHPRTKPKAANFALRFARGEFLVVYDAEDRPEPEQLRKAVGQFRRQPRATACLQARLVFDNRKRWIAIQSSLDYTVWFGFLLQGLDRLGIPMPLGGTSNHFRTSVLRAIHAWDPFNVTEDADVGIRLAALGYRVSMFDSTTYEEAPERVADWIKQRSRWLKGYMQTWLVHSRSSSAFVGQAGLRGFFGFHLFIGGTVLSALINPILWAACIASAVFAQSPSEHELGYISAGGVIASNGLLTVLAVAGSAWRGDGKLSAHGMLVPVYWLLISVAAYRGLWQLITKPFYWEKTVHSVSEPRNA
jgi:cellulose synthase/poly-beta-1,6-N-acetylglucosamine synthase-like glycosyltransferase